MQSDGFHASGDCSSLVLSARKIVGDSGLKTFESDNRLAQIWSTLGSDWNQNRLPKRPRRLLQLPRTGAVRVFEESGFVKRHISGNLNGSKTVFTSFFCHLDGGLFDVPLRSAARTPTADGRAPGPERELPPSVDHLDSRQEDPAGACGPSRHNRPCAFRAAATSSSMSCVDKRSRLAGSHGQCATSLISSALRRRRAAAESPVPSGPTSRMLRFSSSGRLALRCSRPRRPLRAKKLRIWTMPRRLLRR